MKKKMMRYLLHRYLGKFFDEELLLEQLDMEVLDGHGKVENVALNVHSINKMLANTASPMECVNGYVGCISVSGLYKENIRVLIEGLEITLQPKRGSPADLHDISSSLYHSFSDMTTSMELAEGCIEETRKLNESKSGGLYVGLDALADYFESILERVQLSFTDTIIRVGEIPDDQETSIAIEVCIDRIDCFDEKVMGDDVGGSSQTNTTSETSYAKNEILTCKCLRLSGVQIFLDEVTLNESAKSYSPDPSPIDGEIGLDPSDSPNQEQANLAGDIRNEPMLIAKLYGSHELKVRIRENDFAAIPKIDIECFLGSFAVLMSPHQVHLLLRFVNNISSCLMDMNHIEKPEAESPKENVSSNAQPHLAKAVPKAHDVKKTRFSNSETSSVFSHSQKTLDHTDFQNSQHEAAESEYGASLSSLWTGFTEVLNPQHGKFFQNSKPNQNDQFTFSGAAPQRQKRPPNLETAGNCRYQVHLNGFVVTVLHSNPFPSPSDDFPAGNLSGKRPAGHFEATGKCDETEGTTKSSCEHVDVVQNYFALCASILAGIFEGEKSIETARDEFAAICGIDHLRLVVKGVHLNLDVKSALLNLELSFSKAELTECLLSYHPSSACNSTHASMNENSSPTKTEKCFDHSQLLKFLNNENAQTAKFHTSSTSPDLRIRVTSQKMNEKVRTSLHVHMTACETEVDISIIDRINALLSYNHFGQKPTPSNTASLIQPMSTGFYSTYSHFQKQDMNEALRDDVKDRQVDIDVSCSFLRILFRFPVADLRPEMQRRPWYTRLLRDEILILEGHSFAVSTSFASSEQPEKFSNWSHRPSQSDRPLEQLGFEVTFKDLHVLYSDIPGDPKSFIYISQAPADRDSSGATIGGVTDLDYPIIKVTFRSPNEDHSIIPLRSIDCQSSPHTAYAHDYSKSWSESEDFPSSLYRENLEPSPFSQKKVMYNEKEIIMPGDAKEVSDFADHAISTSHVYLLIKLPAVNIFLESHSFFENLYNRINNDILLWEPAAPKPHLPKKSFSGENDSSFDQGRLDLASRLSIHRSDSDSSSIWSESDDVDVETFDLPSMQGASLKAGRSGNSVTKKQSMLSITTKIGYGKVRTKCNMLNPDGTVSDTEHGEVIVMLENATIFNVTSYGGNPNLDYVSIQAKDLELFHKANIESSYSFPPSIGAYSENKPVHLDQVLGKCFDGITETFNQKGSKSKSDTHNMLDLVIKIETNEKCARHCLIAARLNNTFLQHRFATSGSNWFEQIANFFDATDDQVLGYEPPPFITEIHLTFADSAVGYKPLYMSPPVNAIATVSSFCFTSNIVTGVTRSVLDMMLDDAQLYITNKLNTVDLLSDYARVVEINFLEVCLKLSDEFQYYTEHTDLKSPVIEFSLSNNMVTFGTCTDSCILLCSLIRYICNNGDFCHTIVKWEGTPIDVSTTDKTDECTVAHDESKKKEEDVDLADLIADAVLDVPSESRSPNSVLPASKVTSAPGNFASRSMMEIRRPNQKDSGIMGQSLYIHSNVNRHRLGTSKSVGEFFVDDDDFCIIDDELMSSKFENEPLVKYRDLGGLEGDTKIVIVENHFEPLYGKIDHLQAPKHFPTPVLLYTLNELSFVWYMYGGKDFQPGNSPTAQKKSQFASSRRNSRNLSSPVHTKYPSYKSGRSKKTGSSRDSTMSMELHLMKVSARYEEYPDDTYEAKRFVLVVNNFEIKDKLQSSSINKFLYRFHSESSPKQAHAKAMLVKLLQIRPEGVDAPLENKLRISLQPLRLNVDQDTLNFLTNFFSEISVVLADDTSQSTGSSQFEGDCGSQNRHSQRASPVVVNNMEENAQTPGYTNNDAFDNMASLTRQRGSVDLDFFREVVFSPAVPIRLDYHGKRIDTEQGTVSGLLMGLGQLNCSELCLKKIVHRHGLLGADKVVTFLLNEWASDIRANQLPSILGGLGPLHSVTQIVKGVRDLLYLPVEQYRKDGRIVRGIQRGATSFGTSTAMATLEVANGAIGLLQSAAETTYELISPSDTHAEGRESQNWRTLGRHARRSQPADIREGVSNAYTVVKHGVEDTATSIVKLAQKEHDKKGVTAAVGVVLRHIPPALVRPVIVATEATSNVLSGIRNQIKPDAKQQDEDKWKNIEQYP